MTDSFDIIQSFLGSVAGMLTVLFIVLYLSIYRPSTTTAGRLLLLLMISFAALGLSSFTQTIFGPLPVWWEYVQIALLMFVCGTVGSMSVFLVLRRWWPHTLVTVNSLSHDERIFETAAQRRLRRRGRHRAPKPPRIR